MHAAPIKVAVSRGILEELRRGGRKTIRADNDNDNDNDREDRPRPRGSTTTARIDNAREDRPRPRGSIAIPTVRLHVGDPWPQGRASFAVTDAYKLARELAVLIHAAKITRAELRDQAQRAVVGAFLQLSEGFPNESPAMRRRYFTIARNSLCEVVAAVDLASALGSIGTREAQTAAGLAKRLREILYRLMK